LRSSSRSRDPEPALLDTAAVGAPLDGEALGSQEGRAATAEEVLQEEDRVGEVEDAVAVIVEKYQLSRPGVLPRAAFAGQVRKCPQEEVSKQPDRIGKVETCVLVGVAGKLQAAWTPLKHAVTEDGGVRRPQEADDVAHGLPKRPLSMSSRPSPFKSAATRNSGLLPVLTVVRAASWIVPKRSMASSTPFWLQSTPSRRASAAQTRSAAARKLFMNGLLARRMRPANRD
jgi:hypothetical protein